MSGPRLAALPHLHQALLLLGTDICAGVDPNAMIPGKWTTRAYIAEGELSWLTAEELKTLVYGDEEDAAKIVTRCPTAHALLNDAFDGDLGERFFPPLPFGET